MAVVKVVAVVVVAELILNQRRDHHRNKNTTPIIQKVCSAVCVWMIYRWILVKLNDFRVADLAFILNVLMIFEIAQ